MNKKVFISILPIFLLCSCGKSSSISVPTVTYTGGSSVTPSTDTTPSTSNSDVITDSLSVNQPDISGASELSEEEARNFVKAMSEVQKSESFKLPNEIDVKVKTTGNLEMPIEGATSLDSNSRMIYSKNNDYFRNEATSSQNIAKEWGYIGSHPKNNDGEYYITAILNDNTREYSAEQITNADLSSYEEKLYDLYKERAFESVTGNSVLSQFDAEVDETTRIDCKYYTKGNGSFIVTGTITVNNFEFTVGESTFKGSMKSVVSYTWENYVIVSGETDTSFKIRVLISDVEGHMKSIQTSSFSPSKADCTLPNYSNFEEKVQ